LNDIIRKQRAFFNRNETKSYLFRKQQLETLRTLLQTYEQDIKDALYEDLHKSSFESYSTEIGYTLHNISLTLKKLKKWMKPKKVKTPIFQLNTKSYIQPEPLGTVLIIGPYNYPFQLVIEPLIGAIAAGNTAIIKPSEMTPKTEAVITRIINDNFPEEYIHVITGDATVTQALLQQRFDHIFFTGSTRVGQLIYEAASKHLTPVTLELGGKSPTIIDKTADIKMSAQRTAFAKFINAGQTCIAPDYIYVHEEVHDQFIDEFHQAIERFYAHYDDFGHIVNKRHFNRLLDLIEEEKVTRPLDTNEQKNFIAPVVMKDVTWDDAVMKEEIFGPIVPILSFTDINEVIARIKENGKPLALYLFTTNKAIQAQVLNEVSFGGGSINDALLHITNHHLPFGGVGQSGIGAYHGKHSFDLFSHQKGYTVRSFFWDPPIAYPPYSEKKERLIKKILK
jgi:aldehyde dehydrogenase (NAD+)